MNQDFEHADESSFPCDGTRGRRWSDEASETDAAGADHDLVMATARRVIASDAAIIHRLGTI